MDIVKLLLTYWDSILVVIAFIVLVVVLIKRGEIKVLNNILYKLVTQAEREFGAGTGELKYAAVSDWIYERLPVILKFLFTAKDIDNMIETALQAAKKKWAENENLKLYIAGAEPTPPKIIEEAKQ